jgi:hypothetical protein
MGGLVAWLVMQTRSPHLEPRFWSLSGTAAERAPPPTPGPGSGRGLHAAHELRRVGHLAVEVRA